MKHTPTPWVFDQENMKIKGSGDIDGLTVIANVSPKMDYSRGMTTQCANAEHIVHCVNTHDSLVDLIKELTRFAANDFREGFGGRSDEYTKVFYRAFGLVKHHEPDFDPFEACPGVRSDQESTSQFLKSIEKEVEK